MQLFIKCDWLPVTWYLHVVMAAFEFVIESSVRGFHVYKAIWTPTVNEQLKTKQEHDNAEDWFFGFTV